MAYLICFGCASAKTLRRTRSIWSLNCKAGQREDSEAERRQLEKATLAHLGSQLIHADLRQALQISFVQNGSHNDLAVSAWGGHRRVNGTVNAENLVANTDVIACRMRFLSRMACASPLRGCRDCCPVDDAFEEWRLAHLHFPSTGAV